MESASERLIRLNETIMDSWEKRAVSEVAAALPGNSLILRNSLPEFLNQIASALDIEVERTRIRVRWDRSESTRVGKKHGRDRAHEEHYTMDQLIFEYSILRQVVCEVMDNEFALSMVEREIIVCAIEQAVNDAATEFSAIYRDLQETLTNTLAHDLRTPIASAKLGAQMLIRSPDVLPSVASIATRIVKSMNRLDQMIRDLLDGSRLRAGQKLTLSPTSCDLNSIVDNEVRELSFSHPNRLVYKSVGAVIGWWDEGGLKRVIDNLVSNALKFSSDNSVVTVVLRNCGKTAELSVQNFGEPIPQEQQALLFQNFSRAKNSKGRPGWGLGLTVVKGITEALGGTVDLESSLKDGTTFKITLPITAVSEPEQRISNRD